MKKGKPATLLLALMAIILLPAIVSAQEQERVIDKLSWRTEPIKIIKLKTKGKAVELGKKFSEKEDWLKGLTVTVENISSKAIARIELQLAFPRPGEGSTPETATYVVPMIYGWDPADASRTEALKPVLSGERADVTLLEVNLPFIKTDLENLGYPKTVSHAQIRVHAVTFLDGSQWAGDEILYPNPYNPKQKTNPRFPIDKQGSDVTQPPIQRSALPRESSVVGFVNAGFHSTQPRAIVNTSRNPVLRVLPIQTPVRNAIYVRTDELPCGPAGEGCTYGKDIIIENPPEEVQWQNNARKGFTQARCFKSDGSLCLPNPMLLANRVACGTLVATGTCNGLANWIDYPSTGCITGLIFGGPCTRSTTFQSRCLEPTGYEQFTCSCPDGTSTSPIVIDVDHSGFSMTDAAGGVVFDMLNDDVPLAISWTAAGSTNSLLVLDRNTNGMIDSGEELFGDITPQPPSSAPNGFLRLGRL